FHDDQHGTAAAVITLAADKCFEIIDKERLDTIKVVISGASSAVYSIFKILRACCNDSLGDSNKGRRGLENNPYKKEISINTNQRELQGTLAGVIRKQTRL